MNIINASSSEKQQDDMLKSLALLSDEFKAPLSVTLSAVELIQTKMQQKEGYYTSEYDNLFSIAIRNIYKTIRMANNFTDAEKILKGGMKLRPMPIDIVNVTRQMAQAVQPLLLSRGVISDFFTDIESGYFADVDEQAFERVFLNLVSNSLAHLSKENGRIIFSLNKTHDGVVFEITDNGSGISDNELPYVFEKYWHEKHYNPNNIAGRGLGLYIVKSIVNLHGGTISVSSLPYLTTTFTIYLPKNSSINYDPTMNSSFIFDKDAYYRDLINKELFDFL